MESSKDLNPSCEIKNDGEVEFNTKSYYSGDYIRFNGLLESNDNSINLRCRIKKADKKIKRINLYALKNSWKLLIYPILMLITFGFMLYITNPNRITNSNIYRPLSLDSSLIFKYNEQEMSLNQLFSIEKWTIQNNNNLNLLVKGKNKIQLDSLSHIIDSTKNILFNFESIIQTNYDKLFDSLYENQKLKYNFYYKINDSIQFKVDSTLFNQILQQKGIINSESTKTFLDYFIFYFSLVIFVIAIYFIIGLINLQILYRKLRRSILAFNKNNK